MTILQKVTLKSLLKNKTRSFVTIIGILLATSLITALATLVTSIIESGRQQVILSKGNWQGSYDGISQAEFDSLKQNNKIVDPIKAAVLGYAEIKGGLNKEAPYLYLLSADESFHQRLSLKLSEGAWPSSDQEIILPDHLIQNGGFPYQVGDKIKLTLGRRVRIGDERAGEILWQDQKYLYKDDVAFEKLESYDGSSHEFTVSGMYRRPVFESFDAPGYTAITGPGEQLPCLAYMAFFNLKDSSALKKADSFLPALSRPLILNEDLLNFDGYSRHSNMFKVIYSIAAILFTLILLSSVSLIYNAFAISVNERSQQFGLFSSVGATPCQNRQSVLFEALLLSACGIPLGMLAGIGGMTLTLHITGKLLTSITFGADTAVMSIRVSFFALVFSLFLSLITILISAFIPAHRAARMNAMDAIRQSKDLKIPQRQVRTARWIRPLFGFSGELALKNFKRNKKSYRAPVISLLISIVLFISSAVLSSTMLHGFEAVSGTVDHDLSLTLYEPYASGVDAENLYRNLRQADQVTSSLSVIQYMMNVQADEPLFTAEFKKYAEERKMDLSPLHINVLVFDDQGFSSYLKSLGEDAASYLNPKKPKAVLVNQMKEYRVQEDRYYLLSIFQNTVHSLDLHAYQPPLSESSDPLPTAQTATNEASPIHSELGKIVDSIHQITGMDGLALIFPQSVFESINPYKDGAEPKYYKASRTIYLKSDDHAASAKAINDLLQAKKIKGNGLIDIRAMQSRERIMELILKIFVYGFSILIALIATANVFNTISTNIALRRREIAMLRSLGMDRKMFARMLRFECLAYGFKALIIGLPLALFFAWLIQRSAAQGLSRAFFFPWQAMLLVSLAVFVIVALSMLYAAHKLRKDDSLDALRAQ